MEDICIVGCGIAGMTTALALANQGLKVIILEKNKKLDHINSGIQLSPNATSLLEKLGLLDKISKNSIEIDGISIKDYRNNQEIIYLNTKFFFQKSLKYPYLLIQRSKLLEILYLSIKKHHLINLKLEQELVSWSGSLEHSFFIRIFNKSFYMIKKCSILIFSDGINSKTRSKFFETAKFSGYIAWRSVILKNDIIKNLFNDEQKIFLWMGVNSHLVMYPLDHGRFFNIVAIIKEKNISEKFDTSILLSSIKEWNSTILNLIIKIEKWVVHPILEMPFPRFLGTKNEIFLGDASHGMLPFAAQGAAMAIEDALSLSSSFSQYSKIHQAIYVFNKNRYHRIKKIKKQSSWNGYVYHAKNPLSYFRNIIMKIRKPEKFLEDINWIYNFDATKLN